MPLTQEKIFQRLLARAPHADQCLLDIEATSLHDQLLQHPNPQWVLDKDYPAPRAADCRGLANAKSVRDAMVIFGSSSRAMIRVRQFNIYNGSDPWTTDDQRALSERNARSGNPKIGVIVYRDKDEERLGEVYIFDVDTVLAVPGGVTGHGKVFYKATGRLPQTGDVGCGFAFKVPGVRQEDPARARELQWDSYTFNHGTQGKAQGPVFSDFHTAGGLRFPRNIVCV